MALSRTLKLKASIIGTPLEGPASALSRLIGAPKRMRHPELKDIYSEARMMDICLRQLIQKDFNCIDIGCHIGSVLNLFSKLAPNGKHMAFEPVPDKAAMLRSRYPHVELIEAALSDSEGTATFHENLSRPGFSSLGSDRGETDEVKSYEVKVKRLDDCIDPGRKIGFIKIDVEGAELPVIRGADAMFKRDQPTFVFESGPKEPEAFGYTHSDLLNHITGELGYKAYRFIDFLDEKQPLDLDKFLDCHKYPFKAFNFLALPH